MLFSNDEDKPTEISATCRDYADSGCHYAGPDSGGECGVPYETYFPMPTAAKDKPWYSIEQASIHFTVISTEHDSTENSEQVKFLPTLFRTPFKSVYM